MKKPIATTPEAYSLIDVVIQSIAIYGQVPKSVVSFNTKLY